MTGARGLPLGQPGALVPRRCSLCLLSLPWGLGADYPSGWRSGRDFRQLLGGIAAVGAGKQLDQDYQHRDQERGYPRDPHDQEASNQR
jgi:hypothetical protein